MRSNFAQKSKSPPAIERARFQISGSFETQGFAQGSFRPPFLSIRGAFGELNDESVCAIKKECKCARDFVTESLAVWRKTSARELGAPPAGLRACEGARTALLAAVLLLRAQLSVPLYAIDQ